ncbi:hypothetical protein Tco_1373935, partial [Tanacetum coccineum]
HPSHTKQAQIPLETRFSTSFSAKGTKREVFGMPIPNDLITDDIRGEQYYNAYLEKVDKHQRYLAGEEVSDPDSPAPKLDKATKHKATKKSKPSATKAAPVTKPAVAKASKSQQTKSAPAKPQEKKRKLVTEISEAPSLAKRSKAGKNEPRLDDEEAATQRAIEESLKERFREGKEKVSDEQVALDLLTLQTPKKKSPTEQYIFQRRTSTPTESSGHDESSSLYAELGLTVSETESDEEAGPNPGDAAASQPPSSHVVHAGPNLEHMDLEAFDTSIQPNPEQMDEEFTTTAYLNVQENLKLLTEGEFLAEKSQEDEAEKTNIEAEVQSMVTVPIHQDTSLVPLMTTLDIDHTRIGELEQHMADLVQANLALEERMDKHGSRLYKLENLDIPHQVSKAVDEIVTDVVDWAIQAPLRDRFRDFPGADMKEILYHRMWESNSYKAYEDQKKLYEALEQSMAHDHTDKLLTDLAEARKKKKKRHDSPKTPPGSPPHQPPPPLPPAGPSGTSGTSRASGSS